jgi:hypothetical protein
MPKHPHWSLSKLPRRMQLPGAGYWLPGGVKGRWDNAGHGVQVGADCGGHLVTVGAQVQGGGINEVSKAFDYNGHNWK